MSAVVVFRHVKCATRSLLPKPTGSVSEAPDLSEVVIFHGSGVSKYLLKYATLFPFGYPLYNLHKQTRPQDYQQEDCLFLHSYS